MTKSVRLLVNGTPLDVADGITVAAALLNAGYAAFRRSAAGQARGPVCGMGICFECRVTIDGEPGRRSCMMPVRDGMQVTLDD